MREEEGRGIERELRQRMAQVQKAGDGVEKQRQAVQHIYVDKLKARMQELIGSQVDPERLLQEAALLVDRSDIQEELVRLDTHVKHFLGLLEQGGEVGKKLDFLLQEMNREANTLLSKTSGLAGNALKITEMGLAIKTEIEKARNRCRTSNEWRVHHSAPSGSGKSTLVDRVRQIVPGLKFSISIPPGRTVETSKTPGILFVSRPEFEEMIRKDEFLEHADVFGNYYGTARRFMREAEQEGKDLLLDIDVQGAAQIKGEIKGR